MVLLGLIWMGWGALGSELVVKEYTGTHLTQPTTANKPLVRRGMLNLLGRFAELHALPG
jgi:hypothetical protein